jgi:hypothetical protein
MVRLMSIDILAPVVCIILEILAPLVSLIPGIGRPLGGALHLMSLILDKIVRLNRLVSRSGRRINEDLVFQIWTTRTGDLNLQNFVEAESFSQLLFNLKNSYAERDGFREYVWFQLMAGDSQITAIMDPLRRRRKRERNNG